MSDYYNTQQLPEELLIEIVIRLPVKSIIRWTSVSKRWCSLITSDGFKSLHLHHTTTTTTKEIFYKDLNDVEDDPDRVVEFFHITDSASDSGVVEVIECPLKVDAGYFVNVVGSANGLVCLVDTDGFTDRFVIWNPAIRKVVVVPRPKHSCASYGTFDRRWEPFKCAFGFGYDSGLDDYKLVRIMYCNDPKKTIVEVYSLRRNCWKKVSAKDFNVDVEVCGRFISVFYNGACHWLGTHIKGGDYDYAILSFSLGDEVFREFGAPGFMDDDDLEGMTIGVFEGSLALFPLMNSLCMEELPVCVMKSYGDAKTWMKCFNVASVEWLKSVVVFKKNGEALLGWREKDGNLDIDELFCYNLKSGKTKHFLTTVEDANLFYYDTYVESLLLLGEGDGILKKIGKDKMKNPILPEKACEENSGSKKNKKKRKKQKTKQRGNHIPVDDGQPLE